MNPVKALQEEGQSVWLDFLSHGFGGKGSGEHIEPKA